MTEAPRRADSVLRLWTKSILAAIAIWLVLRTFVVEAFRIPSGSMEQTLLIGDLLFVNKALYGPRIPLTHWRLPAARAPRHGEILVFDSVEEPGHQLVKRVIGLPGDTLAMRGGRLIRNGQEVLEPYAVHGDPDRSDPPDVRAAMRSWQVEHLVMADPDRYDPDVSDWGPIVVPADSLFMMGDNRENSRDSRYWGFLPLANVRGRPIVIYFSYDGSRWRGAPLLGAVRWRRIFSTPE